MTKIPSFPLFAQDFDMNTNTWTNEEIGVYLRLLLSEWINGPLPNDTKKLAQIARISQKKFKNLFRICSTKFIQDENGFLINENMEEIRKKVNKLLEQKKNAGIESAKKRWGKGNERYNERVTDVVTEPVTKSCQSKSNFPSPPYSPPPSVGGTLSFYSKNLKKETQEVLDYINKKFNRKFSDGSQITMRLKQGGTVEECKQIIDTKSHDPHFQANPHLFCPSTLFRKSHWDTYLNQKPSDFKQDGPEPISVPYKLPEIPKENERVSSEEIRETLKMLKKGGLK